MKKNEQLNLNKNLVAACGLYCGSCGIYLASKENNTEKLLQYAVILKQSLEETYCEACGSEKKSAHCSKICTFIKCKQEKEISYCGYCKDFFCSALNEFHLRMPHRMEIEKSQRLLISMGWEKWIGFQEDLFRCSNCNTINSAYHLSCRKCGNTPSCQFVAEHKEIIEKYLRG